MAIPASGIPASLLANAQGIVIIPDLVNGGFVVGVRHGRGIVMVRDERGFWRPPSFVTLTGGSVGWQIGLQVTDIVLVFKTRSSVQGLLKGQIHPRRRRGGSRRPGGTRGSRGDRWQLLAEIFTWSRSRGLFAGYRWTARSCRSTSRPIPYSTNGERHRSSINRFPFPLRASPSCGRSGYFTGTPGDGSTLSPARRVSAAPI